MKNLIKLEAVRDFLNKNQMRPAVLSAAERAIDQFEDALNELVKWKGRNTFRIQNHHKFSRKHGE